MSIKARGSIGGGGGLTRDWVHNTQDTALETITAGDAIEQVQSIVPTKSTKPPASMPTAAGNVCKTSMTGTAIGHLNAPYLTMYRNDFDDYGQPKLVKDTGIVAPSGGVVGAAFNYDGSTFFCLHSGSPYVTSYYMDYETLTYKKATPPTPNPFIAGNDLAFSNNFHLAIALTNAPRLKLYQVNDQFGSDVTALADLAEPPTSTVFRCAYSADASFLALGTTSAPFLYLYNVWEGYVKLPSMAEPPTNSVTALAWSQYGGYLAVGQSTSPYIILYRRQPDNSFIRLPPPNTLPTGKVQSCSFSHNGQFLAVTHEMNPFISIYRTGEIFLKLANPSPLPSGTGNGIAWAFDSASLAVAYNASPYLTVYGNEQEYGIRKLTANSYQRIGLEVSGLGLAKMGAAKGQPVDVQLFSSLGSALWNM